MSYALTPALIADAIPYNYKPTAAQMALVGMPFPPPRNWRKRIVGLILSDNDAMQFFPGGTSAIDDDQEARSHLRSIMQEDTVPRVMPSECPSKSTAKALNASGKQDRPQRLLDRKAPKEPQAKPQRGRRRPGVQPVTA